MPQTWVFNDFGHLTCYIAKDRNRNGRYDPSTGEEVHGEFLHTTPLDEARSALNQSVKLTESHGCIHLKPLDIDGMVRDGHMRKNTRVVVHAYSEKSIPLQGRSHATPPFELHFYPGLQKTIVVGSAAT